MEETLCNLLALTEGHSSTNPAEQALPHTDDHVIVPRVQTTVYISKQLLLNRVAQQLQLTIHSFHTVHESTDKIRGCVKIDMPPILPHQQEKTIAFHGEATDSSESALESVAETVLLHLQQEANIKIMVLC